MNWTNAMLMIFSEAIACFACWCDPKATAPGGPVLLLIATTGICLSIVIGLYRQDLTNHLPRSAITTQPMGGDLNQEGMGEVPEKDAISALAERRSNSVQSGQTAKESLAIGAQHWFVHTRDCHSGLCQLIWWLFRRR